MPHHFMIAFVSVIIAISWCQFVIMWCKFIIDFPLYDANLFVYEACFIYLYLLL
jgi:hypothetical protein